MISVVYISINLKYSSSILNLVHFKKFQIIAASGGSTPFSSINAESFRHFAPHFSAVLVHQNPCINTMLHLSASGRRRDSEINTFLGTALRLRSLYISEARLGCEICLSCWRVLFLLPSPFFSFICIFYILKLCVVFISLSLGQEMAKRICKVTLEISMWSILIARKG